MRGLGESAPPPARDGTPWKQEQIVVGTSAGGDHTLYVSPSPERLPQIVSLPRAESAALSLALSLPAAESERYGVRPDGASTRLGLKPGNLDAVAGKKGKGSEMKFMPLK